MDGGQPITLMAALPTTDALAHVRAYGASIRSRRLRGYGVFPAHGLPIGAPAERSNPRLCGKRAWSPQTRARGGKSAPLADFTDLHQQGEGRQQDNS